VGGAFVETMRSAMTFMTSNQLDSAKAAFQRAQALFPDYAGPSAPAMMLAKIAFDRGDYRGALEQVQRVTPGGASLTSNCVWPQWQLPLIGTMRSSSMT